MTPNRYAGVASFLLALSWMVAPLTYLTGNLRDTLGILGYSLADFLYGPVTSACLVFVIYLLRELIGKNAVRRMDLALLAAVLAALGMAAVAFFRAANREYHLAHPNLHLENDQTVLLIWTTLIAGVNALGFHFLGWVFVLVGSAGWSSRLLPRPLCVLYFLAGLPSWLVYRFPDMDGLVLMLGVVVSIWLGFLFWRNATPPGKS